MPSTPGNWLTAAEYAAAVGIAPRNAQTALARAHREGRLHRGRHLDVRQVPGGGNAGGFAYMVRADCLTDTPAATAAAAPAPSPAPDDLPQNSRIAFQRSVIDEVLRHPRDSRERSAACRAAASIARIHPNGRHAPVGESTIWRWLADSEAHGVEAFREYRTDRGTRRVRITRAWDRAVPFDDATRDTIAEAAEAYVRRLWASTLEWGWKKIARFASEHLAVLTEEHWPGVDAAQLRKICKLPRRYVERHREDRVLAKYQQDRKRWEDEDRPRIRRTRAGRMPMGIVICDVRPCDNLLPREDGSTYTAKLVTFEDWATKRLFQYPVFLEKGQGIRQSHIVEAFIAMVLDPRWGMPGLLYLDNGGEYGCMDAIIDVLRRVLQVRALHDDPGFSADLIERRGIVRATPYNAAAKSIESAFAGQEILLSGLPGSIGGDRMQKKTANVGRAPVPYPHGLEAFRKDLQTTLDIMETTPLECFGGRTPREVFDAACAGGWRPATMTRGALLANFATDDSRVVRQGAFKYKANFYTAPEIQDLPAGRAVHLRIPIVGLDWGIPVMTDAGELLCMANKDEPFDVLDVAGAKEAAKRGARARAAVRERAAEIGPLVEPREVMAASAARAPAAAMPGTLGPVRDTRANEAVGRKLERDPARRRDDARTAEEISRERQQRALRRILGKEEAA